MTLRDLYHANMNWTIDTCIDIRFSDRSGVSDVLITKAVNDYGDHEVEFFHENYVVLK